MQYTVNEVLLEIAIGWANFVLANKHTLANKRLNMCYCYHKHIRLLLTRIYGLVPHQVSGRIFKLQQFIWPISDDNQLVQ